MKANGEDKDSENVQPIIKIPPSLDRTENTHRSPTAVTSEKKKISKIPFVNSIKTTNDELIKEISSRVKTYSRY